MKIILISFLMFLAASVYAAPPVTIWNRENTRSLSITPASAMSVAVDTNTLVNVSGSNISVTNFPADFPDSLVANRLSILTSTTTALFREGQLIGNTHFDVSGSSVHLTNQISGFATESTLAAQNAKIAVVNTKDVVITSGTLSVNNFPTSYNVSGSTVIVQNLPNVYLTTGTVRLNPDELNRVVIRNNSPARDLAVNSHFGFDVRLHNNVGTLISTTAPLPVDVYTTFISSYISANVSELIKSGATDVSYIIVGTAGSGSSLIVRNGTTAVAPIVMTLDTSTLRSVRVNTRLSAGLFVETTGTTSALITIVYR